MRWLLNIRYLKEKPTRKNPQFSFLNTKLSDRFYNLFCFYKPLIDHRYCGRFGSKNRVIDAIFKFRRYLTEQKWITWRITLLFNHVSVGIFQRLYFAFFPNWLPATSSVLNLFIAIPRELSNIARSKLSYVSRDSSFLDTVFLSN